MMHEGERQMQAFESGERYTPSEEMVAHAEGMMREWESDMVAHGAPPEFVERAREEFARWSSGEMEMGMMGGPGHEMMGPGGAPSPEQMQAMVDAGQMTPEQFQMAQEYMANPEAFAAGHPGYETFGPDAMGSGGPPGGAWEGGATWEAGPHEGMTEYAGMNPTEAFEHWAAENQMSPEMEAQYREMAESYQPPESNYAPPETPEYIPPPGSPGGETPPPQPEGPHTLAQDNPPGMLDGWDGGDADLLTDHTHAEGTAPH
jgi:hypothetical protein